MENTECLLYTLDGIKKAKVVGQGNPFAAIVSEDGKYSLVVNWQTVSRKMEGDKTFYAC